MSGLYRNPNESSYVSSEQIQQELQEREAQQKREEFFKTQGEAPVFETPLLEHRSLEYWSGRFIVAQEGYVSTEEFTKQATIRLPNKRVAVTFTSDWHVGAANVDYKRLEDEAMLIANTPYHYVITCGDLADQYNFNPAQLDDEIQEIPEQAQYVQAYFRYMAEHQKLLAAVVGNHDDKWAKKSGLSLYHNFAQTYKAYLMRGLSFITLFVGDQPYKVAVSHQLQGSSIRDPNWSQKRAFQEAGAWGADIVIAGHTHEKGYQWRTYREFGNPLGQDFLALQMGTYKISDSYTEDRGMGDKPEKEIGALTVILDNERYDIVPHKNVATANRHLVEWHSR